MVLSVKNIGHPNGTFLVRGVASGIVIEKIYPLCFDKFTKIVLLDEFKLRRAKLYFLRDKVGKAAKLKSIISSDRRNMDLLTLQIVLAEGNSTVEPEMIDGASIESVIVESADMESNSFLDIEWTSDQKVSNQEKVTE